MPRYTPIGLDIGSAAVKVAQLSRSKGRWTPLALAGLSWNGSDSGPDLFDADFAETVRSAVARSGAKGRRVVVSAPADLVDVRPITVPMSEGVDLMSFVQSELSERHSQLSSSFVCDYWIAGETVEHGEAKLQAYSVSAPRERVVALVKGVERAGLICTRVEAPATALARCLAVPDGHPDGEATVVLDLGHRSSLLLAVEAHGIGFCRVIKWGSRQITAKLAAVLQIGPEAAERIKTEQGLAPSSAVESTDSIAHARQQQVNDSIEQELRGLALEIGRSLAYWARSNPDRDTSTLRVTGGGARLRGLDRFIRDALRLTVQPAALLDGGDDLVGRAAALTQERALGEFGVAMGAALMGVS